MVTVVKTFGVIWRGIRTLGGLGWMAVAFLLYLLLGLRLVKRQKKGEKNSIKKALQRLAIVLAGLMWVVMLYQQLAFGDVSENLMFDATSATAGILIAFCLTVAVATSDRLFIVGIVLFQVIAFVVAASAGLGCVLSFSGGFFMYAYATWPVPEPAKVTTEDDRSAEVAFSEEPFEGPNPWLR